MLIGTIDLDADRLAAAILERGKPGRSVNLNGDLPELPCALALDKRQLQIGTPALRLCRKSPHLTITDLLPRFDESIEWRNGRHRLTAKKALIAVLQEVQRRMPRVQKAFLIVPSYFSPKRIHALARLSQEAGLPVVGAVTRPMAAALASFLDQPWHNVGLFVDVDSHALTMSLIRPSEESLARLKEKTFVHLGNRIWQERIMGRIADLSVRVSRRDPRDSAETEQSLFDQIDQVFTQCSEGRPALLEMRSEITFQTVTLTAQDARQACEPLAQFAAEQMLGALKWVESQMTTMTIYLTPRAAQLPGLAASLYQHSENRIPITALESTPLLLAGLHLASRVDQGAVAPGAYDAHCPVSEGKRNLLPFPERPVANL